MHACIVHDTLISDDGTADECVECGATFPHPAARHVYIATQRQVVSDKVRELARSHLPPHRRLGWFHNYNVSGAGALDTRRARR